MKKIIVLLIAIYPLFTMSQSDSMKVAGDSFVSCSKEIFERVEQMPYYNSNKGGYTALFSIINKSLKKDKSANGDLMLKFIINCKGQICQIEIQNSFNVLFDQRLILELLRLQNWLPGKQNGTPIDCKLSASLTIKNGKIKI